MTSEHHHAPCHDTYAVILAGGRGTRLGPLTAHRAKPAVPFAGKLKIIDFALSNCVNSGVRRIGVLTQYKAQSLIRHIERGWGFLSNSLGEYVDVVPAQQQQGEIWYLGTADAVWQNRQLIAESHARHVLVLGGDHVYKMDYGTLLAQHVAREAQATVACLTVPAEQSIDFGTVAVDDNDCIVAFEEKTATPRTLPGRPDAVLASMGVYVFEAEFLLDELARDAAEQHSRHDFGYDILPSLVGRASLVAHRFEDSCVGGTDGRPYWRDVGTIDAYFEANMDLIRVVPELNLYDEDWPILSQQRQLPPAKFVFDESERRGTAVQSLVASGCIVSGATVRRSILSSKVTVAEGSLIEDSLLLPNVSCGRRVQLAGVIVDKNCKLPEGFRAGQDAQADLARGLHRTPQGVTLVTPEMLGQVPRSG